MYMGLTFKGKVVIQETSPRNKMIVLMPKSAEASAVKILKADGSEQVVE